MKFFTSVVAALLTSSPAIVSAFVSPSSSTTTNALLKKVSSSQLKMSETIEQLDVSSYMKGPQPEGTEDYIMQQTMIRVKDPKASLDFYCNVLGFKLLMYKELPQWKFNVYFVAPVSAGTSIPEDADDRWKMCMNTPGCIELTYNYGSEVEDGKVYNTGNADTTGTSDGQKVRGGFGHIGITVPNVYRACERFHKLGVEFHKSPNSGGMKGLAFIKDPDGYLIEVLPRGAMEPEEVDCLGVSAEGGDGYKDNSK